MAEMSGIFAAARDQQGQQQAWVQGQLENAITQATVMRDAAKSGIDAMANIVPGLLPMPAMPSSPSLSMNISGQMALPALASTAFGTVTPINRADIGLNGVAPIPNIDITDFEPGFEAIVSHPAPEFQDPGAAPTAPTLGAIALPTKPQLERPVMPGMTEIVIPEFTFPTLPEFQGTPPEFQATSVDAVLQWTETPYEREILDDAMAKLRGMWDGQLGLPPAVEQALWERAASREDQTAMRDVSAAAVEFSGRGYTLPPGALVARVDAIRTEAALRKTGLGREILIKIADTQVENLRFACTTALAAEQVLVSIWREMAARSFDAAKHQMDSQLALLNAQVAIFNARQSAYRTSAEIFKINLDAQLSRIQVYKAQLDGEIAKGQINEQRVRMYGEMVKALMADLEIYKTEMQGAQLQSELQRNEVDVFKARVSAFGEVLNAQKVRFEAYESQMKGEQAKASLIESRARAYAAYVGGQSSKADIARANQSAELQVQDQRLRAYIANLDKDKVLLQAQLGAVQSNADAHRANTARFTAQAGAEADRYRLQIQGSETQMRTSLAVYEAEVRRSVAEMEQMIRVASLQLEALKAAGQASATLAAGAMAGVSLGANVQASSTVTAGGHENINMNVNTTPTLL